MTRGLFPWKRRGRFHGKRCGPSAARRVFFRKCGFRKTILIYFAPQARNSPEGLFAAGAANSAGEGGGKVVEENGFSVTLEAASGWFLTLVFKIFKALGLPRALNRAFYARL